MITLLKELAAGYTAVRISMKAGLLQKSDPPAEMLCECIAVYSTGIVCALLLPLTAPVGVAWAAHDAYKHRDTIIAVGQDTVSWCKDKWHNLRSSWINRGAIEHVAAVGEN